MLPVVLPLPAHVLELLIEKYDKSLPEQRITIRQHLG